MTGSGPALILSHGFSATSAMWGPQVEALSRDHTLIVWDMRGHGQSASPDDPEAYSEALTVDDIASLLDAAGQQTAVVGGLSLGGYMSLAFHRAYPERVRGLMLFSTGPGYKNDQGRDAWNRRAEAMGRELEDDGLARAARGMLAQRDAAVIESLPKIAVPTLIVVGEHDEPFLQAGEYMARKIPGAAHVVVPAAGHTVNIDQADAFNAVVRRFLATLA